jgi:hypothetical protein
MTGDLRSQILVDIQQNGADTLTAAAQQLAKLKEQMGQLYTEFKQGSVAADDFQKAMRALESSFNFFNGVAKDIQSSIEGMDRATIKHMESVEKAAARREQLDAEVNAMLASLVEERIRLAHKEADAREAAELRQAEALAREAVAQEKLLADYQNWVTRTDAAAASTGRLVAASGAATASTWQYNMAVSQVGFALGDLMQTSGGWERRLMSTTNNVQMMLSPWGIWGAVIGVAATALASVAMNWDSLASLVEDRNPVPKSADALQRLKDELKDVSHELEQMRKHTSLNNEDTERYNSLLEKQVKLEHEKTEEIKRRKELEQLGAATNEPGFSAEKERAAMLQDVIGQEGGSESFIRSVAEAQTKKDAETQAALLEAAYRMNAEYDRTGKMSPHYRGVQDQLREVTARLRDPSKAQAFAESLVTGATVRGETSPFEDIRALMGATPGAFTPMQIAGFNFASDDPNVVGSRAWDKNFEIRMERATEAGKARREKAKDAAKKSAELGRELTEQGKEIEHAALRQMAENLGLPHVPADQGDLEHLLREKKAREGVAAGKKAAREAKAAPREAVERNLVDQFDVTPAQAHAMAPGVMRRMGAGMSEHDAGQAALASAQEYLHHQQIVMLKQQAYFEQLHGMFGEASRMLAQVEANQRRFQMNMRSSQPSMLPPIPFR